MDMILKKRKRLITLKEIDSYTFLSTGDFAHIAGVSRQTIIKWLAIDEFGDAVIPPHLWFRLPSGHIRISVIAIRFILPDFVSRGTFSANNN